MIGDQGITFIAGALREVPQLKELDVSLNEIGPTGFQALCEVLPFTGIVTLVCNKNFLCDEIVGFFAQVISQQGQQSCALKKFDLSSCRLNDSGLVYLINAL